MCCLHDHVYSAVILNNDIFAHIKRACLSSNKARSVNDCLQDKTLALLTKSLSCCCCARETIFTPPIYDKFVLLLSGWSLIGRFEVVYYSFVLLDSHHALSPFLVSLSAWSWTPNWTSTMWVTNRSSILSSISCDSSSQQALPCIITQTMNTDTRVVSSWFHLRPMTDQSKLNHRSSFYAKNVYHRPDKVPNTCFVDSAEKGAAQERPIGFVPREMNCNRDLIMCAF